MDVQFVRSTTELRCWFEAHHASVQELWIGFHKKGSGK
jgi:hypothetical protein